MNIQDIEKLSDEELLDIIDELEREKGKGQTDLWRNNSVSHRSFIDDYERADIIFKNDNLNNKIAPFAKERNKRGISFSQLYRKKFGL